MPNQSPKPDPKGRLAALLGLAAAATLTATVALWEGKANRAYRDLGGVLTICWGDTAGVRPGQLASDAECGARLERALLAHAEPVLACVPGLRGRPDQAVAAMSLAYNIGTRAFCRSRAAAHFRAGRWREGCDAMRAWHRARVNGRLVPVRGLLRRRAHEHAICIRGLAVPPRNGGAQVSRAPHGSALSGGQGDLSSDRAAQRRGGGGPVNRPSGEVR